MTNPKFNSPKDLPPKLFEAYIACIVFYRLTDIMQKLGVGKSTVYNLMEAGLFPKQISISPKSVGWPSNEVNVLINARIANFSDQDIQAIVKIMHENRGHIS